MARPLFQASIPGPEVTISVRRALGAVDRENPALTKMMRACETAKLKPVMAFHLRDCWAHVGIPSKKTVVYMRQSSDLALFSRVKEQWESHGWKCLTTTTRQIEQSTFDDLVATVGKEIGGKR